MFPAAYRRARKLTESQFGSLWLGHLLTALQALFLLKLLLIGGLLLALCESGGTVRLETAQIVAIQADKVPKWLHERLPPDAATSMSIENTGLGAISWPNRQSSHPLHRLGAKWLGRAVSMFPILRDNQGVLKLLLAMGLLTTLGAAYFGLWRRSLAAKAAGAAASSLRRQIHRQIYRLGQSALPVRGLDRPWISSVAM